MSSTQEILAKVDMAKLLTQIGFADVDPTKSKYLGLCVFHNDSNTKSFSANLDAKLFHCFGCKIKGNAIQLYARWKNVSIDTAKTELDEAMEIRSIDFLARQLDVRKPVPVWRRLQLMAKYINQLPLLTSSSEPKKYMNSRGLSDKVLDQFGVRAWKEVQFLPEDKEDLTTMGILHEDGRDRFSSHPIIFPYWLGTSVTFIQGRVMNLAASQMKYIGLDGTIPYSYNHEAFFKYLDGVYLCEGAMDTLSMVELGHSNVVGIPGVDAFKASWLSDIRCRTVCFAFDNDKAGAEGQLKLTEVLKQKGISTEACQIHVGFKDINECLQHTIKKV